MLHTTTVRFQLAPIGDPYDVALRFAGCSAEDRGGGAIVGTRWNDLICGRSGADLITGGPGRDTLLGGRGNDTLLSRDRARDEVRCGPGRDRAVADRRDRVARDCEHVTRR
jgi:Ca2+-binding RTX toxin-like protein